MNNVTELSQSFRRRADCGHVAVNADKDTVRKVNASRAAEMLGVTKGRVSQMVKANQLEAFRDGGTVWVTLDSIEARLAEKPKAGRPAKAQATA